MAWYGMEENRAARHANVIVVYGLSVPPPRLQLSPPGSSSFVYTDPGGQIQKTILAPFLLPGEFQTPKIIAKTKNLKSFSGRATVLTENSHVLNPFDSPNVDCAPREEGQEEE